MTQPAQAAQPSSHPGSTSPSGVVRFYNFLEDGISFRADVQAGLSSPRKTLPARWRFDAAGMQAFDALCAAPEYYLARTEQALLNAHLAEMAVVVGPDPVLIEIGPPAAIQSDLLIAAMQPHLYLNVGVDAAAARVAASRLAGVFPALHIAGMLADPAKGLDLPKFAGVPIRRKVAYLSAVAAGAYARDDLSDVLRGARGMVGAGGALIVCIDLQKSRQRLEAAGNDAQGLAAQLNRNLLYRINRELGGDFQPARFSHVAVHNEKLGCTGFYLESEFAQIANVAGQRYHFEAGEVMLTGIASQSGIGEFEKMAADAGFAVQKLWSDSDNRIGAGLMVAV